jgi:hypothetical protein
LKSTEFSLTKLDQDSNSIEKTKMQIGEEAIENLLLNK